MNIWKEIFYGIVRSVVAAAGYVFRWMVSKGLITETQAALATLSLVAFVWAVLWSVWQKLKAKYRLDLARLLHPEDASNEVIQAAPKNATIGEIVSTALSKNSQ